MWIFGRTFFVSATRAEFDHPGYQDMLRPADWREKSYIMVRGRIRGDLESIIERYIEPNGAVPEIFELPYHDYRYRFLIEQGRWADIVREMVIDVDYSNFKLVSQQIALTPEIGQARADLLAKVWEVMREAETYIR